MKAIRTCIAGLFLLLPLAGFAQWQWIDKDGNKVFSDRGPPPGIPDKDILRRVAPPPRPASSSGVPDAAADAAALKAKLASNALASAAKPSGLNKDLAEKTRKAEEDAKAARDAEAQKVAKTKADNCATARQNKSTLDSGIRIAQVNAKGERIIMDDPAKAAAASSAQSAIDSSCI